MIIYLKRKNFGKAYINECCKENISVDEVFFNNDNDCYFFLVLCSYASLRFDMIYIIRARKFHFMGRFFFFSFFFFFLTELGSSISVNIRNYYLGFYKVVWKMRISRTNFRILKNIRIYKKYI